MTLEEAEQEIYAIYHYFAREAPGVTPVEHGRLANLWRFVDLHLEEAA